MINNEQFLDMVLGGDMPLISDVEAFTELYPWCALGHKALFTALCARGKDASLPYLPKTAVYLFDRSALYTLINAPIHTNPPRSTPAQTVETQPEPVTVPRVAGGDYFSKADFNSVLLEEENPIDRFIKYNPRVMRLLAPEEEERVSLLDVPDDEFMTETLAKIYADQALSQLAIEAYGKLILLYPKKSDYFASLIQEVKLKTNR